jgi:hypothetical protein
VSLARDGLPLVIGATGLAVVAFVLALRLRSWPLWLVAFGFVVAALGVAWLFRAPLAGAGA